MTVQTDEYLLALDLPVSAERLYQSWLDEAAHAAMIGADVVAEGDELLIWDGYIRQRIVEAEPGKRLVLAWRTEDFPAEAPDSHLELKFIPLAPEQARLELTHRGIPAGKGSEYSSGFEDYYFAPMVRFFGGDPAQPSETGGYHEAPGATHAAAAPAEPDEHEVEAKPAAPVMQHGGGGGGHDPKADLDDDEEDDDFWGEGGETVDIRAPQAPAAHAPAHVAALDHEHGHADDDDDGWSSVETPLPHAAPASVQAPAAPKKPAAKKPAVKAKPAAKKAAAAKPPAKAAKKPAAKPAKKPAGKKAAAKPAAKAAKKPVAKPAKKPAAKAKAEAKSAKKAVAPKSKKLAKRAKKAAPKKPAKKGKKK